MDYPVCISIPEQSKPPNDGKEYIKHVEFFGNDESSYRFQYKQMEGTTMLFEYWIEYQKLQAYPDRLMSVTFKPVLVPKDQAINFCKEILIRGIFCEKNRYRFLGHSEFQLRERNCYLMNASEEEIHNLLEQFRKFSKIANLGKRAKSIAMLFTEFDHSVKQGSEIKVNVMQDAKGRGTYHCGFMSRQFSSKVGELLELEPGPSALLVLYQGFQGMLVLKTDLKDGPEIQLHPSMQKFVIPEAMKNGMSSICVLEHSSPYVKGYLDSRMVMLLASRGVSTKYLKELQTRYFDLLNKIGRGDKASAEFFLYLSGKHECVKDEQAAKCLQQSEIKKMKCDVQNPQRDLQARTRILVPRARVVFCVCDPHDNLKYGECYFDPTLLDDEKKEFLAEKRIVVARSPCYHPGDILVLELAHGKPGYEDLKDCLVLPLKSPFPHTFVYSPESSRGCKFFVSWDPKLFPTVDVKQRFLSTTKRDGNSRIKGNSDKTVKEHRKEMLKYFATHMRTKEVQDRIDEIYMRQATAAGPSSRECEELSRMVYQEDNLTIDSSSLEKELDELERVQPEKRASFEEPSCSEEFTENTPLTEDGSETQSQRKFPVIPMGSCLSFLSSFCGASGDAQTFPVPGFEVWKEFDKRTEEFLKEI